MYFVLKCSVTLTNGMLLYVGHKSLMPLLLKSCICCVDVSFIMPFIHRNLMRGNITLVSVYKHITFGNSRKKHADRISGRQVVIITGYTLSKQPRVLHTA